MYPAGSFTCLAFITCSIVCLQVQTDAIKLQHTEYALDVLEHIF